MDEFEEQLRLERELATRKEAAEPAATYKDADGTVFEWDAERRGWFPKVDDDFLAMYHLNYGNYDNSDVSNAPASSVTATSSAASSHEPFKAPVDKSKSSSLHASSNSDATEAKRQRTDDSSDAASASKPSASDSGWFELPSEKNTNVYVTGLPSDFTDEEFVAVMSKCGMVKYDTLTKKPKVKLYRHANGQLKGDALCTYIKAESVELALQILDEYSVRPDATIKVERARFERKTDVNAAPKEGAGAAARKRKLTAREKRREAERQASLFKWTFESNRFVRARHERVVIVSNAFDPAQFDADPLSLETFRTAVRETCSRFGELRKVVVYDRNPLGVVSLTYDDPAEADVAIAQLEGRVAAFAQGRVVQAAVWDGRTRYAVEETEEEFAQRRQRWSAFLKEEENREEERESASKAVPAADDAHEKDKEKEKEDAAGGDGEEPKGALYSLYAELGMADGGATPTHVEDVDTDGEERYGSSGESSSSDESEKDERPKDKDQRSSHGSSFDSNDERFYDDDDNEKDEDNDE